MDPYAHYRITCELEHEGVIYLAYLCPYYDLSEVDLRAYGIKHYSYLVHVFSPLEGFRTFEMFPDDRRRWTTDASALLINLEIVRLLSYVLLTTLP